MDMHPPQLYILLRVYRQEIIVPHGLAMITNFNGERKGFPHIRS